MEVSKCKRWTRTRGATFLPVQYGAQFASAREGPPANRLASGNGICPGSLLYPVLYRYTARCVPINHVEKWRRSVADVPAYPSLIIDALIINCMCNTLYCCMVHPIGHPSIASHLWRAPQRTLLELRRRRFQYDGTQSAMRCAPRSQGKAVRNGAQGYGRYNL